MSGTLQGLSSTTGGNGANFNASLVAIAAFINNQQSQSPYDGCDQIGQDANNRPNGNQLLSAPPSWGSNQNAGYSGNTSGFNLGDICKMLEQAVQDQQNAAQNWNGGNAQQSCGPTRGHGSRRKQPDNNNNCNGNNNGYNSYGNPSGAKGFPGFNGGGGLAGNVPGKTGFGGQFSPNYTGNYNGGPTGSSVGTGSSSLVGKNCNPAPACPPPVQNNCPPKPAPVCAPPAQNTCPPPQNECAPVDDCKPKGFEANNGFNFKSVGDPHVETSVNGGKTVKKDVNQDIPNFSVVKDTKGGATKTSTETTPKDANGVAYNDEVNLKHGGRNGWDLEVKRAQDGKALDATLNHRNGTSTKIADNTSITTPDGETISQNAGKLTVAQNTNGGGKVESTISANGGGLDLVQTGTGKAVLAGAALDQALTA